MHSVATLVAVIALLAPLAGAWATGGEAMLIEASEDAPCTVVGRIVAPERIDRHGYAAWLSIEEALAGACRSGDRLRLGWEELAQGRAPRFADGDRILVSLEPIPGHSLWVHRFADDLRRGTVLTPAAGGTAFAKIPPATRATIELLSAYVRATTAGDDEVRLASLAGMVRDAPLIAGAAVARLEALGPGDRLPAPAADVLANVVTDPSRPRELRAQILAAAGRARWAGLRPALVAQSTAPGEVRAAALGGLAALDGGLAQDRVADLLDDPDPGVRAVAARNATSEQNLDNLPALLASDPAAPVRAAAAATLLDRRGLAAFARVRPAFADPAAEVGVALAAAFARLGEEAVAPLENVYRDGSFAEARGAALALAQLGTPGKLALERLAHDGEDAHKRRLAEVALGRLDTHSH